MKDLLIRVVVGALVGSIVSAGVLYFAFDQSMRGMETAIDAQSTLVSENGNWIRSIDTKLQSFGDGTGLKLDAISKQLDQIASNIALNRITDAGTFVSISTKLDEFKFEVALSVNSTAELAELLASTMAKDTPEYGMFVALLGRMREHQAKLETIDFKDVNLEVSPGP